MYEGKIKLLEQKRKKDKLVLQSAQAETQSCRATLTEQNLLLVKQVDKL